MLLKTLIGVAIFARTTVAAVGQEEPTNQPPKRTFADVQYLVEVISGDKSKLRAYCELGMTKPGRRWNTMTLTRLLQSLPKLTRSNNNLVSSMTNYSTD